jgi:hypothetical protein
MKLQLANKEVRFVFYHEVLVRGKKPVHITTCKLLVNGEEKAKESVKYYREDNNFNKNLGKKMALNKIVSTFLDKEDRKSIWDSFFTEFPTKKLKS